MDAQTLAAIQGPLKERYREDPAAAEIVLRAEGSLGEDVGPSIEATIAKAA